MSSAGRSMLVNFSFSAFSDILSAASLLRHTDRDIRIEVQEVLDLIRVLVLFLTYRRRYRCYRSSFPDFYLPFTENVFHVRDYLQF